MLEPCATGLSSVSAVKHIPTLPLLLCAGAGGLVGVDTRTRAPIRSVSIPSEVADEGDGRSLAWNARRPLEIAVGTADDRVMLFDLRSSRPLDTLHLRTNEADAVHSVQYHTVKEETYLIASDTTSIRVWKHNDGGAGVLGDAWAGAEDESAWNLFTVIQPELASIKMTQTVVYPESGMIFCARDCPKLGAHFIPALGPAPKFCYYLEGLTEELEESGQVKVYDEFEFVTRERLAALGAADLIETSMLQETDDTKGGGKRPILHAYMHGYLMPKRMYERLVQATEHVGSRAEELRKEELERRIQAKRGMRSSLAKEAKKVKVNENLWKKLQESSIKAKKKSVAEDDRFKALFEDADFVVEEM